jgi:hypothetical protein
MPCDNCEVLKAKLAEAEADYDEAIDELGERNKIGLALEEQNATLRRALFGYRREHDADAADDQVCGCDLCRDATAALATEPKPEPVCECPEGTLGTHINGTWTCSVCGKPAKCGRRVEKGG